MPRYIDADELLARYKERCAGCKETRNYCEHCCDIADVIGDIEDAPTIDAVEVVRCKDCKHYNAGFECIKEGYGIEYDKNYYCADGERRRKEKTDGFNQQTGSD